MTGRYFAYGSNMNPARMAARGLMVHQRVAARLVDFRLVFDKIGEEALGVGHANVIACPGTQVEGALYHLAADDEILKMDPFERAPVNYGREAVLVETGSGACWAWTYFANSARRASALRPTREYLEHLLAGEDLLSPAYLAKLRQVACLELL